MGGTGLTGTQRCFAAGTVRNADDSSTGAEHELRCRIENLDQFTDRPARGEVEVECTAILLFLRSDVDEDANATFDAFT